MHKVSGNIGKLAAATGNNGEYREILGKNREISGNEQIFYLLIIYIHL